MSPRGLRNNNPGNIRRSSTTHWLGQADVQTDESFVTFNTPQYGIRAIARILKSYQRLGLETVNEVINRWAPPNENDSSAYVNAVCDDCHVTPTATVDINARMSDLIKAIIRHENGQQPYDDSVIDQGIALAA